MGAFQCSDNEDRLFLKILDRKIEEKDTHLDRRIHNEYLKIKGLKNNIEESEKVNLDK
jgi:hypothetical protein